MLSLWVVFLSAVTLCVATSVDDCPDNLKRDRFLQAYSGYCFYFHMHIDDAREYRGAKEVCKNDGGTLALPKTSEINGFLHNNLYHTYNFKGQIWIGLSDRKEEGKFIWEDGSPLGKWQNWAPGSGPKWEVDLKLSDLRDMVTLDTRQDGRWVEDWGRYIFSSNNKAFVCQFKAKPARPTTIKHISLKPTTPKSTTLKSTTLKPTTLKPTTLKPTTLKLTTFKHTTPKQSTQNLTTQKPTTEKTTTLNPTTQKPTSQKQTTQKPTTQKPTTQKPTTQKPTTQKPTTQRPTTQAPTTLKPTTQKPTTEKPTTEKPTTEKPSTQIHISTTVVPTTTNPTSQTSTAPTAKPTCPPFVCDLDCGMDGYISDPRTGCTLCKCDEE